MVNKKNDFFSIQRLLSIQPIDLKFKQLVDQKCSKSNDARVVYVRPRVVVAPTAAPNKVVRLVLLNLALSFPQAHIIDTETLEELNLQSELVEKLNKNKNRWINVTQTLPKDIRIIFNNFSKFCR